MAEASIYMTPEEFAALPATVHHAVWQAATDNRIATILSIPSARTSCSRLYRRDQVQAIMRELQEAR